ncbi:MAG: DUF3817 domain-containing protein [Frankiaceae bacterium]|jgi:integral membrane protein|nr:DUF3817 domain-containing protein [Frankiaceae bacterium]
MSRWTQTMADAGVPPQLTGALLRFRIMAWVTGVALLSLCLAMVLHYAFGTADAALPVVAQIHGYLYIGYLVTVVHLSLVKQRWPLPRVLVVMLAGTIPLLSFVFERRTTHRLEHTATSEAQAGAAAG